MKSMTGYGYSEKSCDKYILSCEIKSYNSRYQEFSYNSPSILSSYEMMVLDKLKKKFARGRIEVSIKLKTLKTSSRPVLDFDLFNSYLDIAKQVEKDNKDRKAISLKTLLSFENVIIQDIDLDNLIYNDDLFELLDQSIEKVDQYRTKEGQALLSLLTNLVNDVEKKVNKVSSLYSKNEENIKKTLQDRCDSMLISREISEDRVLSEVAMLLVKYTIEEEIGRLKSHITFFNKTLLSNESIGKRLDFLAQEMHREINTIGSKNNLGEISSEVVKLKELIENIREQLRNVE